MEAMPCVDYLFGNETEAAAFAESEGWPTDSIPDIALKVLIFFLYFFFYCFHFSKSGCRTV